MNAIVVEEYGDIKTLIHKKVDKPSSPEGHDVLVRYAFSVSETSQEHDFDE